MIISSYFSLQCLEPGVLAIKKRRGRVCAMGKLRFESNFAHESNWIDKSSIDVIDVRDTWFRQQVVCTWSPSATIERWSAYRALTSNPIGGEHTKFPWLYWLKVTKRRTCVCRCCLLFFSSYPLAELFWKGRFNWAFYFFLFDLVQGWRRPAHSVSRIFFPLHLLQRFCMANFQWMRIEYIALKKKVFNLLFGRPRDGRKNALWICKRCIFIHANRMCLYWEVKKKDMADKKKRTYDKIWQYVYIITSNM